MNDPTTNVWIDDRRIPAAVYAMPELTPLEWLAMLPGVVAQLEPERHEEFVLNLLRKLEAHKIDMASCVIDEMAGWWR